MTSRRRTLTSPAVVSDLRRKLYADNHQQQPPYGDLIKRIELFLDRGFLYIWLVLIVGVPLVLIALVAGFGNFTVEWLYAAGIALFATGIYMASLTALYSANALAAGDKRGIKGIIGSLSALISIGLLGWIIGAPKSDPPSPLDIRLALFCGGWFAALLMGIAIDNSITNAEERRGAKIASLLTALLYSIYINLQAYSFAWNWPSRPDMRFWMNVQSSLSSLALITSVITLSMRQHTRKDKRPARE